MFGSGNRVIALDGGCVDVSYLVLGMIANNTYVISDGKGTMVVDPCCHADRIMDALGGKKLDSILCTHRHYDHVGAAAELRELSGAEVVASQIDAPAIENPSLFADTSGKAAACKVDRVLNGGDNYVVGDMKWKVIATPGHTEGGICLFLDSEYGIRPAGMPLLISGDTLFCGTIGRTDFQGGSLEQMKQSLKKLAQLPDNTLVLPGHNDLTTIGAERNRVFRQFGI